MYCPRKDNVEFFRKVFSDDLTQDTDLVSYIGDWNIVLNQLLDTSRYLHENNVQNRAYDGEQMIEKELFEVWWRLIECNFNYIWACEQQNNRTLAWFDFLLTSINMLDTSFFSVLKSSSYWSKAPRFILTQQIMIHQY